EQDQQAAEVHVVERGLDLVQDVERARPSPEDRAEQRHRGERPFTAREQGQPLDLLARWARLDLDTGVEHVVGIGEDEAALTAGEEHAEDLLELPGRIFIRGGEYFEDSLIDVLD